MFKPGAHYVLDTFFSGEITEEQAKRNIFCYGKPHSGKTKIGIISGLYALEANRSCVVYAQNASEEYAPLKEMAAYKNIPIIEMDATDFSTNIRSYYRGIRAIKQKMAEWKTAYDEDRHNAPFLMLLSDRNIQTAPSLTIHDIFSESVFDYNMSKEPTVRELTAPKSKSLLLIMDDMIAPLYLAPALLLKRMFQFCIIMATADIAAKPWRLRAFENIARDYRIFPSFIRSEKEIDHFLRAEEQKRFSYFFRYMEIVICTGNTVKPDEHRDFIRRIIHQGIANHMKAGHRYICEEIDPATHTNYLLLYSRSQYGSLSIDSIAESNYWDIANEHISAGKWLLLINDKVAVESNIPQKAKKESFVLEPVSFLDKQSAQVYLELEWSRNPNISMTEEEIAPTLHIYRGTKTEDGITAPIEYALLHLGAEDVDDYRLRFLYRSLQILEQVDVGEKAKTTEDNAQLPVVDTSAPLLPEIPPIEPYWEKYQNCKTEDITEPMVAQAELPDRALFLGGHRNMVKKLGELHPDWDFITDDEIKGGWRNLNYAHIFFWTKHCSHMLQQNIMSKLAPGAEIIYVTATNVDRLEEEMLTGYRNSLARKKRGE